MPSVEYTQSKGLIQKSSTSASLDLRGELSGYRQAVRTLTSAGEGGTATPQLTVADSGKELLIGAGVTSISLPAVAGVKTTAKFTADGVFTIGEVFTFEGFGRKFKLKVVADNADADNGKLVSTDADGVKTFQLEQGANTDGAITNLRTLLATGANQFLPLQGVAVQVVQGGTNFKIDASTVGSSNNGTLLNKDGVAVTAGGDIATNLAVDILPTQGQDAISDAKGLRIRLVAAAIDGDVVVKIPVDQAVLGRNEGSFVGTVKAAAGVFAASGDQVTIENDHDVAGDFIELLCDGGTAPKWYVSGIVQGAHGDDILTFATQS